LIAAGLFGEKGQIGRFRFEPAGSFVPIQAGGICDPGCKSGSIGTHSKPRIIIIVATSAQRPGGGYTLGRVAKEITVADIIFAVDEPLDATQCGGKENCADDQRCMTHDLWANLNARMVDYLDSVSLLDLVEQQKARVDKPSGNAVLHDNRPRAKSETDEKNETALT